MPEGAGSSLELPLNAISRSNWNPEPADASRLLEEVSRRFSAPRGTGLR